MNVAVSDLAVLLAEPTRRIIEMQDTDDRLRYRHQALVMHQPVDAVALIG